MSGASEEKATIEELSERIASLEKTNQALMGRVERSVDSTGSSFSLFERNIRLQETVNERTKQLEEMNTELTAEIVERKEAERQIRQSLQEKEVLLKEVHHRVKNNLQIITSLLNLQAVEITDPDTREKFRDSMGRVKSMAIIHERLYQTDNLAEVALAEYIDSLTRFLAGTVSGNGGRINIVQEVEDVALPIDMAVPCGLIVNELVTNSLKHAFPDERGGEVKISCSRDVEGVVTLSVRDSGVGLPDDIDPENLSSLGMRLVHNLTDQLDGSLEFGNDGGAAYSIEFMCKDDEVPLESWSDSDVAPQTAR